MAVSDAKLEAMAQAIAEAFNPSCSSEIGWKLAPPALKKVCRQAAHNALAVMEKSEL